MKRTESLSAASSPPRINKSKVTLSEAVTGNHPLAIAYYLKEDLSRLWDFLTSDAGAEFLDGRINRVKMSELKSPADMA